jgi:hypothetical protein
MVCCAALAIPAAATTASTGLMLVPSVYGDARMGVLATATNQNRIYFTVKPPPGLHRALTVTAWLRLKPEVAGAHTWIPYAVWCPDRINYGSPDLLAGAGGFGVGGTNLTAAGGSVTVADFPFSAYTGHPVAYKWPRGVYTIAGSSTQAVTVTLGGTDIALGPGAFNRNAVPGPSDSVVISGAGVAEIGISKTPCYRFFQEISGESIYGNLSDSTSITNEIVMYTWRFRCENGQQIYESNIGRMGAFNDYSAVRTNAACAGYDWQGRYDVGLIGLQDKYHPMTFDVYDTRLFTEWLTDGELDRVHLNGVEEIGRRGIPQWR